MSVASDVAENDRPLYETVAKIFADDPPAPEGRKSEFARYFGSSQYKCVGWEAAVMSIVSNDNGWAVTIRVRPTLMQEAGGVVFTPQTCEETWQLSKDQTLTPLKVVSDNSTNRGFIFVD